MTLTFLDLYNECTSQPWSMFDNDAESVEDFESSMRVSINKAVSFLWNYQPWSFRVQKQRFRTKAGKADYNIPDGIISKKVIGGDTRYGVKYDGQYLVYEPSYELLEEETGAPENFYIDGEKIYIYPTPDDVYTIEMTYLALPYALDSSDNELYELKDDSDYINIPEKYETLFKNCVISLAMMYAIADESDENYSGYVKQYQDALGVLVDYCSSTIVDKSITW